MGKGFLIVELRSGENFLPVANATVLVQEHNGRVLYELTTNENGNTQKVALDAPDAEESMRPGNALDGFSIYDVEVPRIYNYKKVIVQGVQIFDSQLSILPIQMLPIIPGEDPQVDIDIPLAHGVNLPKEQSGGVEMMQDRILPVSDVYIPNYLVVHLGTPNATANNMRVPFKDYIKVICCLGKE